MAEATTINASTRGWILLLAATLLAPLVVAARLVPDARGIGTHQQLGLPVCTWPMALGIPCPSCGMTTAFAHAARAEFGQAFIAQPIGAVLACGVSMGCLIALGVALTGYQFQRLFDPLMNRWGFMALAAFFLAAWFWKLALMKGWLP